VSIVEAQITIKANGDRQFTQKRKHVITGVNVVARCFLILNHIAMASKLFTIGFELRKRIMTDLTAYTVFAGKGRNRPGFGSKNKKQSQKEQNHSDIFFHFFPPPNNVQSTMLMVV